VEEFGICLPHCTKSPDFFENAADLALGQARSQGGAKGSKPPFGAD